MLEKSITIRSPVMTTLTLTTQRHVEREPVVIEEALGLVDAVGNVRYQCPRFALCIVRNRL